MSIDRTHSWAEQIGESHPQIADYAKLIRPLVTASRAGIDAVFGDIWTQTSLSRFGCRLINAHWPMLRNWRTQSHAIINSRGCRRSVVHLMLGLCVYWRLSVMNPEPTMWGRLFINPLR